MISHTIEFLKICGIRSKKELKVVERYANATGVVVSESKRRVSLDVAREIIEAARIPVFLVSTLNNFKGWEGLINKTKAEYIQIHTDSIAPNDVNRLKSEFDVYVMKAFKIPRSSKDVVKDAEKIISRIESYEVDRILLDTGKGSGKTHDHRVSKIIAQKFDVVLAGGLNPENVSEITKFVEPYGLDVSSGVEKNGRKDEDLIVRFAERFGIKSIR